MFTMNERFVADRIKTSIKNDNGAFPLAIYRIDEFWPHLRCNTDLFRKPLIRGRSSAPEKARLKIFQIPKEFSEFEQNDLVDESFIGWNVKIQRRLVVIHRDVHLHRNRLLGYLEMTASSSDTDRHSNKSTRSWKMTRRNCTVILQQMNDSHADLQNAFIFRWEPFSTGKSASLSQTSFSSFVFIKKQSVRVRFFMSIPPTKRQIRFLILLMCF